MTDQRPATVQAGAGHEQQFATDTGADTFGSHSPPHEDVATSCAGKFAFNPLLVGLFPGVLGTALYLLNSLDVIHGLLAAPSGYAPLGVQRDEDVAQYLTWLHGLKKGWLLPNYHAPWTTSSSFIVPGLFPVSILQRLLSLTPVVALQLFSLSAYICAAYALAFAYKTFCSSRTRAMYALLIGFACVPVASLPGVFRFFHYHGLFGVSAGALEFRDTSDGFLHGLGTWPFTTFGTCAQVLSMALLARYCKSRERRWFTWLVVVCLFSALIHPFEILVTLTVVALVLLQEQGAFTRNLAKLGVVALGSAAGLAPYLIPSIRAPWVRQVDTLNRHLVSITPFSLLMMLGLPVILVVTLLLLNFPKNQEHNTLVLKTWFASTFLVFYLPGVPFAVHVLDGLFFAVGLLLPVQIEEVVTWQPIFSKSTVRFLALSVLVWMLLPQVGFRWRAWKNGISVQNDAMSPSSVVPIDYFAAVEWLRENASPNDLVLATDAAAPWMATTPIHSFASHYVFSLEKIRPNDAILRDSFYDGRLTQEKALEFLEILGVRFILVPNQSPARSYLENAVLKVQFNSTAIYERPGAQMKPFGDARIIEMGTSFQ